LTGDWNPVGIPFVKRGFIRLALATAAVVIVATAARTQDGSLEAALRQAATLRGEPALVSAAGLAPDGMPVLTIENPSALDTSATKRRVVLVAADDVPAATAVIAAVTWLKTAAPAPLRNGWAVSAMPLARFAAADTLSMSRWLTFQAPDLVVKFGAGSAVHLDGVRVETVPANGSTGALRKILESTAKTPSDLHRAIAARVARDPLAIAKLLAAKYPVTPSISYIPSVAWMNALRLSKITGDASLRERVLSQAQPWLSGEKPLFGDRIQLTSVAGASLFADLAADADPSVSRAALALAEKGRELASAEKSPGLAQYGSGWTDDMFMSGVVLARTTRLAGHASDIDTAARLLLAYAGRLQRPDGLFNHAIDGPIAWGRGNGFAAMGLAEVLTAMPAVHPQRSALLEIFRRQMAAVRNAQAPDGAWRQIIDDPAAYREETATAMLLTAMARGVRLGWIDRSFSPPVQRAWRALAAHVADDGIVIDVCAGTGSGPDRKYYFDRPAITGADDRGGAMALMAAMEVVFGFSRTSR
jgi:unsaturated rhamnogalacturonyl hydrolase